MGVRRILGGAVLAVVLLTTTLAIGRPEPVVAAGGRAEAPPEQAATPPATYADEVLADEPLLYWPMDDAGGLVVADASGNGRDGAPVKHSQ